MLRHSDRGPRPSPSASALGGGTQTARDARHAFAAEGKRGFVLVWDNAAWHASQRLRRWIGADHRTVKRQGGCKVRVCSLPVQAPWLNPIEPQWRHGKRAIVEPERKRTAAEVTPRVHEHDHGEPQGPLTHNAA